MSNRSVDVGIAPSRRVALADASSPLMVRQGEQGAFLIDLTRPSTRLVKDAVTKAQKVPGQGAAPCR